jgi:hypothetical protein
MDWSFDWVKIIAERQIRDSIERGEFDNLPGMGKPINLDEDAHIPPEMRAAVRLMRNAGARPDWMELEIELTKEKAVIAALRERGTANIAKSSDPEARERMQLRLKENLKEQMREFNTMLLKYTLCCPPGFARPFAPFDLSKELEF